MQKALLDRMALYLAVTLVQQLLARSRKWVQDIWSMAMDRLVYKMTDTMVVMNGNPLLPCGMHPAGNIFVQEVGAQPGEDEACGGAAHAVA